MPPFVLAPPNEERNYIPSPPRGSGTRRPRGSIHVTPSREAMSFADAKRVAEQAGCTIITNEFLSEMQRNYTRMRRLEDALRSALVAAREGRAQVRWYNRGPWTRVICIIQRALD